MNIPLVGMLHFNNAQSRNLASQIGTTAIRQNPLKTDTPMFADKNALTSRDIEKMVKCLNRLLVSGNEVVVKQAKSTFNLILTELTGVSCNLKKRCIEFITEV